MDYGFFRVAAAVPEVAVADTDSNARNIIRSIERLKQERVQAAVFPELCVTGYTCGDLFQQNLLLESAERSVAEIAAHCRSITAFVGVPVRIGSALFNCAAVLSDGKVAHLVPKTFIPNYGEFYEKRWFSPWQNQRTSISYAGTDSVGVGTDCIFFDAAAHVRIGCEICEDAWVPLSPSTRLSLCGAQVIVNLSAGNELIGKAAYRKQLVAQNSAKNICAYVYANAGTGESTQDMVFSGHSLIAENGRILDEIQPFAQDKAGIRQNYIIADIDVEKLNHERIRTETFSQNTECARAEMQETQIASAPLDITPETLRRFVDGHPFVPEQRSERSERAREITAMQAHGLAKRLRHIHCSAAVVGISGGLDSTLALLVINHAFDILRLEKSGIHCITMPGFGTTDRTYTNACSLVRSLGAQLVEIPISDAAELHFKAIGHDSRNRNIVYENTQARERTQILFDYANKVNGIVVGTGDLSELALGWCTYNGDQMSNYGVNASIPKTLVKWLVQYYADSAGNPKTAAVLNDIIATPVSPELLPPETDGTIAQKTEDFVGPYELHDFFLYNMLRFGFSPKKIFLLAKRAAHIRTLSPYTDAEIKKWLGIFFRRFFSQQFKRSCMPDGVKVGTVSLSPRGDWRMPSDACAELWLAEIESL